MKRWLYPAGSERDYLAGIRRVAVRPFEDACREALLPVLPQVLSEFRQDVDPRDIPQSTGWFETLRQAFLETLVLAGVGAAQVEGIVRRVMRSVDDFNRAEFRAVLRSVYGVDIITNAPVRLRAALDVFEASNIALIRSIPQQAVSQLQGKIVEAVRRGSTLKQLQSQIRDEFDITDRRAKLIARDQVGKLNGQLTELRQEEIGVTEYVWRGILDARERPEHVAREGKEFSWKNPPDDGHPGEPINCRCTAEPVLPSWEEMERRITGVAPPQGIYR
jgi:SPP1 gp7 family putative phage head morphogenesis protein